ncbi:AGE family epimerase/isomerase [Rhodococcus sp. NPDC055112]
MTGTQPAEQLTTRHDERWLEAETHRLLSFGIDSSDRRKGFGWLTDDGAVDQDRERFTWVNCRMTHVYALGHLLGYPGADDAMRDGVEALMTTLHDNQSGGWYPSVTANGTPAASTKDAYDHAFVLLAASSAVVAEAPGARALLASALRIWEKYWWDEIEGLTRDRWSHDWGSCDAYRGANANMHTVEALLAVGDVTGDPIHHQRALRITARIVHEFTRTNRWLMPEHFDADWQPDLEYNGDLPDDPFRPYGVTIGHLLEWSRLCLNLAASLGEEAPAWLTEDAIALFDTAIRFGWEADGHPGFVYTVGWDGAVIVPTRLHWVVCEAASAAAALAIATGASWYTTWSETFWAYAEATFIDRKQGSWHHERTPEGLASASVWTGKPDLYHAVQATLIPRLPLAPSLATAVKACDLPFAAQ